MLEARRTALVLGGGGPLGLVWMAEMLGGWGRCWKGRAGGPSGASTADPEEDPLAPLLDGRIIGTSAGAIVGAYLAVHGSLDVLSAQESESSGPGTVKKLRLVHFVLAYLRARLLTRDMDDFRRSLGRSALSAAVPGEREWVEFVGHLYPPEIPWPARGHFLATVIDAHSGEFQAWDADAGVPLPVAVAASCAMPCALPLVHAKERIWMDGGIGSTTNALLAAGCERVLIFDPLGRSAGPGSQIGRERQALEQKGSRTLLLQPDRASARAIGRNFFEMRRRRQVTEAARFQAQATANAAWSVIQGHAG